MPRYGASTAPEIIQKIKSLADRGEKVVLEFPDHKVRDAFAEIFSKLGFKKNLDYSLDSDERLEVKARQIVQRNVTDSLARALEKHDSGIAMSSEEFYKPYNFGGWMKHEGKTMKIREMFLVGEDGQPAPFSKDEGQVPPSELAHETEKERGEHPWMSKSVAARVAQDHVNEETPPGFFTNLSHKLAHKKGVKDPKKLAGWIKSRANEDVGTHPSQPTHPSRPTDDPVRKLFKDLDGIPATDRSARERLLTKTMNDPKFTSALKKHPRGKEYGQMLKNYAGLIKQLNSPIGEDAAYPHELNNAGERESFEDQPSIGNKMSEDSLSGGKKPPLAQARGKYMHVSQGSRLTPYELSKNRWTYEDLPEEFFDNYIKLKPTDQPAPGWYVLKIGPTGELKFHRENLDAGD